MNLLTLPLALAKQPDDMPGAGLPAFSAPPPFEGEARPSRAVVVGVNTVGGQINTLHYAEKDAQRIAEALSAGDEFAQPRLLLGSEATREALLEAVKEAAAELGPGGTLFIYVAGHAEHAEADLGTGVRAYRHYLLLADGDADDPVGTGLDTRHLLDLSQTLTGGAHGIQVFDVCGSVIDAQGTHARGTRGPQGATSQEVSGRVVQYKAAQGGQAAYEWEGLGGGVYTHFWLEGLVGGADTNKDGRISDLEAHRYAVEGVSRTTDQRPDTFGTGSAEVVLTTVRGPRYEPLSGGCPSDVLRTSDGPCWVRSELRMDSTPVPPGPLVPGRYQLDLYLAHKSPRGYPGGQDGDEAWSLYRSVNLRVGDSTVIDARRVLMTKLGEFDPDRPTLFVELGLDWGPARDEPAEMSSLSCMAPSGLTAMSLWWLPPHKTWAPIALGLSGSIAPLGACKPDSTAPNLTGEPEWVAVTHAQLMLGPAWDGPALGSLDLVSMGDLLRAQLSGGLLAGEYAHWAPPLSSTDGLRVSFCPYLGAGLRQGFSAGDWTLSLEESLSYQWVGTQGEEEDRVLLQLAPLGWSFGARVLVGWRLN